LDGMKTIAMVDFYRLYEMLIVSNFLTVNKLSWRYSYSIVRQIWDWLFSRAKSAAWTCKNCDSMQWVITSLLCGWNAKYKCPVPIHFSECSFRTMNYLLRSVFLRLAQRLAGKSISDMTYLLSSGTFNLYSINSVSPLHSVLNKYRLVTHRLMLCQCALTATVVFVFCINS